MFTVLPYLHSIGVTVSFSQYWTSHCCSWFWDSKSSVQVVSVTHL